MLIRIIAVFFSIEFLVICFQAADSLTMGHHYRFKCVGQEVTDSAELVTRAVSQNTAQVLFLSHSYSSSTNFQHSHHCILGQFLVPVFREVAEGVGSRLAALTSPRDSRGERGTMLASARASDSGLLARNVCQPTSDQSIHLRC